MEEVQPPNCPPQTPATSETPTTAFPQNLEFLAAMQSPSFNWIGSSILVVNEIGRGNCAVVKRCIDVATFDLLAVKMIDFSRVKQLLAELRAIRKMNGGHLMSIEGLMMGGGSMVMSNSSDEETKHAPGKKMSTEHQHHVHVGKSKKNVDKSGPSHSSEGGTNALTRKREEEGKSKSKSSHSSKTFSSSGDDDEEGEDLFETEGAGKDVLQDEDEVSGDAKEGEDNDYEEGGDAEEEEEVGNDDYDDHDHDDDDDDKDEEEEEDEDENWCPEDIRENLQRLNQVFHGNANKSSTSTTDTNKLMCGSTVGSSDQTVKQGSGRDMYNIEEFNNMIEKSPERNEHEKR